MAEPMTDSVVNLDFQETIEKEECDEGVSERHTSGDEEGENGKERNGPLGGGGSVSVEGDDGSNGETSKLKSNSIVSSDITSSLSSKD